MTMTELQARSLPVLLVEDNEIDIEITRRVVRRSRTPIELIVARDGAEALAELERRRAAADGARALPRLVLLDLSLPHMDGHEVLRRIKRHPELCPVPVAVLTGAGGDRVLAECLREGSNMYFAKPLSVTDVTHLVSAVQRYWEVLDAVRRRASRKGAP